MDPATAGLTPLGWLWWSSFLICSLGPSPDLAVRAWVLWGHLLVTAYFPLSQHQTQGSWSGDREAPPPCFSLKVAALQVQSISVMGEVRFLLPHPFWLAPLGEHPHPWRGRTKAKHHKLMFYHYGLLQPQHCSSRTARLFSWRPAFPRSAGIPTLSCVPMWS